VKGGGAAGVLRAYDDASAWCAQEKEPMIRKLILATLALPLLLSALGGCVVYEHDGGYYHHHYWR
jgi:hypothetical protein